MSQRTVHLITAFIWYHLPLRTPPGIHSWALTGKLVTLTHPVILESELIGAAGVLRSLKTDCNEFQITFRLSLFMHAMLLCDILLGRTFQQGLQRCNNIVLKQLMALLLSKSLLFWLFSSSSVLSLLADPVLFQPIWFPRQIS